MDEQEAAHVIDRFASDHPDDQQFDVNHMANGATEYLGKLPPQQFQQAAQQAYASAPANQQQSLASTLLSALQGRGVSSSFLGSLLGQPSVPSQISSNQYAQLADYARQQHPEAMQQVVRDQPWFLKAMGHPVLMGALAMVASKMMRSRMQQGASSANSKADGLLRRLL